MNFNSPQIYSADRPLHDATSAYLPKRHLIHHPIGSNAEQLTPSVAVARIYPQFTPTLVGVSTPSSTPSTEPKRDHSFHHSSSHHLPLLGASGPPGGTPSSLSHLNASHLSHLYIVPPTSHNGAIVAPQPFRDTMNERFHQDFPVGFDRLKNTLENPDQLHHQASFYNNRLAVGERGGGGTSVTTSTNNNLNLQSNNNTNSSTSRRRLSLLPHNPPHSADSFSLALNSTNSSPSSSSNQAFYNRFEREKYDIYRYSQYEQAANSRKSNSNMPSGHSAVSVSGVYPPPTTSLLTQPSLHMSLAGSFHHQQVPPPQPSSTTLHSLTHNHLSHGHLLNEIYDISNKRPRLSLSNHHHSPYQHPMSLGVPSGANTGNVISSGQGDNNSRTTPLSQELLVDTKDNSNEDQEYNPHFEAISPTPNEESRNEEASVQSAKDEILGNINVIDREISKEETLITKLKKKAQELEAATSKPSAEPEDISKKETTKPSFGDKIYIETHVKAEKIHQMYPLLELSDSAPIYIEMEDMLQMHKNFAQYSLIKLKLRERVRKEKIASRLRIERMMLTYDNMMTLWLKRIEAMDENPVKKQRDQKLREYFEKQFPEIKKMREDRERLQRGARVRSDSDTDEVADNAHVPEMELKKMNGFAVIPPLMLIDQKQSMLFFRNNNSLIEDPMELHKKMKMINIWTECEKELFREKYLLTPKKFGVVSSFLERKSVGDCVQYYYLSKKFENYKQLLRKHAKKRTRQLVRNQQQNQLNSAQNRGSPLIRELTANLKPYPNSVTSVILPYSTPMTSTTTTIVFTVSSSVAGEPEETVPASSSTGTTATTNTVIDSSIPLSTFTLIGASSNITPSSSKVNITSTFTTATCDISDNSTSNNNEQCDKLKCVLCDINIEGASKARTVTTANINQYGLSANDLRNGVCHMCLSCEQVVGGRRQCPIPSCKTPRRKVKHLRPLPNKWIKMAVEQRQHYANKLNIPVNSQYACVRCTMRVERQLGVLQISNDAAGDGSIPNDTTDIDGSNSSAVCKINAHDEKTLNEFRKTWPDNDIERLKQLLKEHGKEWNTISNQFGTEHTSKDCHRLYLSFKHELNLWSSVKEYYENNGKATNSDSDELSDETGDDSSSVEDDRANSDTASASSSLMGKPEPEVDRQTIIGGGLQKLKPLSTSQGSLKSDYDSSATMSADEGQSGGGGVEHQSAVAPVSSTSTTAVSTVVTTTTMSHVDHLITSPRTTSSAYSTNTSSHYQSRPYGLSVSELTTDSKSSTANISNSLYSREQPTKQEPMPATTQVVPTFLINPNAPSIQMNHSHSSTMHYNVNVSASSAHQLTPTPAAAAGVEHPTRVRDLIYKAIEMSLQPDSKSTPTSPAVGITNDPFSNMSTEAASASVNPILSSANATATYPLCLKRDAHSTNADMSKLDLLANSVGEAGNSAASTGTKSFKLPPHIVDTSSTNRPEGLAMMNFSYSHALNMPTSAPTTTYEQDVFEVQDLSAKSSKDRRNFDSSSSHHRSSPLNKNDNKQSRASPSVITGNVNKSYYNNPQSYNIQPAHSNPQRVSMIDSFLQQDGVNRSSVSATSSGRSSHSSSPFPAPTPPSAVIDRAKLSNKSTPPLPTSAERKTPNAYSQLSPKSSGSSMSHSSSSYRDKLLPQTTLAGSITQGTPVVLQQPLPPPPLPLNRFASPPFHPGYDAMLRQMTAAAAAGVCVNSPYASPNPMTSNAGSKETQGSITQGTPLIGQNPVLPLPTASSASHQMIFPTTTASISGRKMMENAIDFTNAKSRFTEPMSVLNRGPPTMYDSVMLEQLAKRQSPNAPISSPYIFPPNFNASAYLNNKLVHQQMIAAAAASGKETGSHMSTNQILIDFNTSKQMQPRRSSSSSEKEHIESNLTSGSSSRQANAISSGTPSSEKSASRLSNSSYRVSPAPSPNNQTAATLFMNDRGQIVRGDDKHPIDPSALAQWSHFAPGFLPNRQNVIQQWNTNTGSSGPIQGTKASVIQAPKSNSPRDFRNAPDSYEIGQLKNSISPLVTAAMLPPGSDAFATLVNTAVQQPSLSVPATVNSAEHMRNTMSASRMIKDSKSLSVEGFEKCLMESVQHQKPKAQMDHDVTDLSNSKLDNRRNALKNSDTRSGPIDNANIDLNKHFMSPYTAASLLQSEHDRQQFLLERKKMEQFDNNRFRSVGALANSSAALNPRLVREPFSSEHFERELRQMDINRSLNESKANEEVKGKMKSTSEMQDEASKLFSQSFQKDSHNASNNMMSAASLISQIIVHQIGAETNKNIGGGGGVHYRQRMDKPSPSATPPATLPVSIKTEVTEHNEHQMPSTSDSKEHHTKLTNSTSGSLRDTIFNVITSNFINTSGSSSDSDYSKHQRASKNSHQSIEGIAATVINSSSGSTPPVNTTNENFKLRKALQSVEKHNLEQTENMGSTKRLATESRVQRQHVIHLASPGNNNSSNKSMPSPYVETLTQHHPPSSTAMVSGSSSMPVSSAPMIMQHAQAKQLSYQTSMLGNWPHNWQIIPPHHLQPPFYNHNQKMPHISGSEETPTSASVSSHQLNLSGHRTFDDYFPSRIAEAMQQQPVSNSNISATVNNTANETDNEKQKSEAVSRSETPKRDSRATPNANNNEQQSETDKLSYPESPSSPGEMVIDENPTSSPDVKSNEHFSPSSSDVEKRNEINKSLSEHSSNGGVIKIHNNCSDNSTPQFEPLSDDEP